ncbi:MAG: bifunctional oligoribonuclease/PAP phosphatase NrnA [Patescibacteria group bacterium]|jgi:phosphoesterase RecJ-like protein|nr:bifunctional oligoribonuclease/PAP phosphatase NrnA [Patescibacteria group bacterium]
MYYRNHRIAYRNLRKAKKVFLVIHEKPDGDAISSVCAMIDLLEDLKIDYYAYCFSEIPENFSFLPHSEKINIQKPNDFLIYDLIIPLDCGSLSRTTLIDEISSRGKNQKVIEFDHHPKVDSYSDIEIREIRAASTTQIIYDFFKKNKIKINKTKATCILTGISTDTGNFLYPSTSEKTIRISSEMLIRGARLPNILDSTWRNKSISGMKLWGIAINNLEINKKYNFATTVITKEDVKNTGANEEDIEGISGFLSNLDNVAGLLMLREEEDDTIKGSFRTSSEKVDVGKIAQKLGGGGHTKAAGFKVKGKIIKEGERWRIV